MFEIKDIESAKFTMSKYQNVQHNEAVLEAIEVDQREGQNWFDVFADFCECTHKPLVYAQFIKDFGLSLETDEYYKQFLFYDFLINYDANPLEYNISKIDINYYITILYKKEHIFQIGQEVYISGYPTNDIMQSARDKEQQQFYVSATAFNAYTGETGELRWYFSTDKLTEELNILSYSNPIFYSL